MTCKLSRTVNFYGPDYGDDDILTGNLVLIIKHVNPLLKYTIITDRNVSFDRTSYNVSRIVDHEIPFEKNVIIVHPGPVEPNDKAINLYTKEISNNNVIYLPPQFPKNESFNTALIEYYKSKQKYIDNIINENKLNITEMKLLPAGLLPGKLFGIQTSFTIDAGNIIVKFDTPVNIKFISLGYYNKIFN